VHRGQRAIELTAKEFDLLDYLMTNPKQVLTRDRILEEVWGYDFMGDSNIIEVYVRYLRLKLEAEGEKPSDSNGAWGRLCLARLTVA
jgi:DNA-binding response OmpR family regulator